MAWGFVCLAAILACLATWAGVPPRTDSGPGHSAATNSRPKNALPAHERTTNLVSSGSTLPHLAETDFEIQLALARLCFSPGSLDGVHGPQTRAALKAFQASEGLLATGYPDHETRSRLLLRAPPLTNYVVSSEDLARLLPLSTNWLGKSHQPRLDYESILELVAEAHQASPKLILRLNPTIDWTQLKAGTCLQVPYCVYPTPERKAASIKIFLADRLLHVYDDTTNLLAQFPCSIARRVEKRPVGRLEIAVIAEHPNYTFDPDIFTDSVEGKEIGQKLLIPPGPNNPVGVAWIGLTRPGYGIHGTPDPEKVGRTESRGCFRLANWNAAYLLKLVWVAMPVYVEP